MEIAYDIFISFKNTDEEGNYTEDRALAYKLYEYLNSKNLKIFFSEATLEELGTDSWYDEIEKALRRSKVFIALVIKEEYLTSKWVQKERTAFLELKVNDKSKAIYSYIAFPMNISNLPVDLNKFECFEDSKPNEFERLYRFIENHLFRYFHRVKDNEFIDENIANPYKGLENFEYKDRENYYGREIESETISQTIKQTNFFTLLGASGSGKSSLLFAGIFPKLEEEGVEIVSFRPSSNPFQKLASLFILSFDELEQIKKEKKLTHDLLNGNIKLIQLVENFQQKKEFKKLYIIIDQFEEIFTLIKNKKDRNSFLDQLLTLVNSELNVTIIISMRVDFLSYLSYHELFINAYDNHPSKTLSLLNTKNLQDVIEQPVLKYGVTFQDGLIDRIINEVEGQAGQLPLLEFALDQLWIKKKGRRLITHSLLDEMKSISHSISFYADSIYEKHKDKKESIKRIFINLVTIGRGTEDSKKIAKLEDFRTEDKEVVLLLANERLLVTNKNEIEIVHEALIREWQQLKEWIDEYRDFLEWQDRLREDRVFYEEKGEKKEDFLKDSKFIVAKDFLGSHHEYISDIDKEFIVGSVKLNKKKKRNKRIIIGSFIFLILYLFFALFASQKQREKIENIDELYSLLGKAYFKKRNLSKAMDAFKQSIEINPRREAEDYHYLGICYSLENNHTQAIKMFQKTIEINPKHSLAYYNMGNSYSRQSKYDKAIFFYKKDIELNPENESSYNNMGSAYKSKKEYDKAIENYKKAIEINPKNSRYYRFMGDAYRYKKEYLKAIEAYKKVVDMYPDEQLWASLPIVYTYQDMGDDFFIQNKFNQAIESYKKALKRNPYMWFLYSRIAVSYYYDKDFIEATKALGEAIKLDSKDEDNYVYLSNIYINQNDYDKAIKIYQKSLRINASNYETYFSIGNMYLYKEEYNKAIESYKKAIKINSSYAKVYYQLGKIYDSIKDYLNAVEAYEKVISINPKHYRTYFNLAIDYTKIKKYNKAISLYKKALKINYKTENIYNYLNLFELQLVQNQSFDKVLEKRYIELFQNKKASFIYYDMLKIFQDIVKSKDSNLEEWEKKYSKIKLAWNFDDALHGWINNFENREIKKELKKALDVFEIHKENLNH